MCIIAGYAGTRQAAPLLIEMLRKTEGMDAGHYTGITTIDGGTIHYRKVVGDLEQLLTRTDAAQLPGTIGIIHSRTPGGQDQQDAWSHPFTCERDGQVETSVVFNGTIGYFKAQYQAYFSPIAESLLAEGFEMKTAIPANGTVPCLSNGMKIHQSDLRTQYISRMILNGTDTVTAMEKTLCDMPAEVIGLMLSRTEPEAITWGRTNFPMHVSFADHGAYLATVPLAFPEDGGEALLLPAASAGLIRKDGYTCRPFRNFPAKVASITPEIWITAQEKIMEHIRQGNSKKFGGLFKKLFRDGEIAQTNAVTWMILSHLYKQGKLKMENETVPGSAEGLTAPRTRYTILD